MLLTLIIAALAAFTTPSEAGLLNHTPYSTDPVIDLTADNYWDYVDSPGVAIVEFWAPFNAVEMIQGFQRLEDADLYRVNVEKNVKLLKLLKLHSVPAVIIYVDGEEVWRYQAGLKFKGNITADDLQDIIDSLYE